MVVFIPGQLYNYLINDVKKYLICNILRMLFPSKENHFAKYVINETLNKGGMLTNLKFLLDNKLIWRGKCVKIYF